MKLKTEDIRGVKFEIEVDSQGQFYCSVDGEIVKAATLELLRKKLMSAQKRKHSNIAIPFAYYEKDSWSDKPGEFHTALAVGLHGANGNVMVKIDGGKTPQQWSRYDAAAVPPELGSELKRLHEAVENAEKALKAFVEEHGFSLKEAVRKAMEEE